MVSKNTPTLLSGVLQRKGCKFFIADCKTKSFCVTAEINFYKFNLHFESVTKFCCVAIIAGGINGFGVTGGAHRLWTHRSYKAKLPLRIILMLCYSSAVQVNDVNIIFIFRVFFNIVILN